MTFPFLRWKIVANFQIIFFIECSSKNIPYLSAGIFCLLKKRFAPLRSSHTLTVEVFRKHHLFIINDADTRQQTITEREQRYHLTSNALQNPVLIITGKFKCLSARRPIRILYFHPKIIKHWTQLATWSVENSVHKLD